MTDYRDPEPRPIDFARALRDARRALRASGDRVSGDLGPGRRSAVVLDPNRVDGCVSGTFTRTADVRNDLVLGYSYETAFLADALDFRGRWITFLNPVLTEITRAAGAPDWRQTRVREFRGFHRIPAHTVHRITYDRCEVVA